MKRPYTNSFTPIKLSRSSRGMTLIVALVLLLIMSIIGVASVDNGAMQAKMSRNNRFSVEAYEIALSEMRAQYDSFVAQTYSAVITDTVNDQTMNVTTFFMAPIYNDSTLEQTLTLEYLGAGAPPSGYSVNSFTGHRFELNSQARFSGTGTFSAQTQGITHIAPK